MPIRTLCNNNIKKAAPLYQVGTTIISNNFELMNQNSITFNYNDKNLKISEIAKEYIQFRLCTIPTVPNEKRPIGHWKEYQKRLPNESEWNQWQEECPTSLGIVCGQVSGNLLVIDFDKQGEVFEYFKAKIPADIWQRLVIEQTPSGGYHIYIRSEMPIAGNAVLAKDIDSKTVLIETRGEGGFIVCSPTQGYQLIQGNFGDIPLLQKTEIDLLLNTARCFDRAPKQEPAKQSTIEHRLVDSSPSDSNFFDWFYQSGLWQKRLCDLEAAGWRFIEANNEQLFFQTPEGDHGFGKHDGNIKNGVVYIFSRAPVPFVENKGYSLSQFFAGVLYGDYGKEGLAKFALRYAPYFVQALAAGGNLSIPNKVTSSNSGSNTQSNSSETSEILRAHGIFVTSVTLFREKKNTTETYRVMIKNNDEPIIYNTFRNQSNKSLLLRVVGGEKHYLTLYLQGDERFEWHTKTSVTSVDGKVTNWLKSFKSEDSYTYIRADNPANPNEWEIDLGQRTIMHNTMSTPRFRTNTHIDAEEVTEEDCRWYWQQMRENREGKYSGDWDYFENSLAYMVQGLYLKHGRPCTILIADDGGTAKKDLSIAIWNIIAGVTRNSLDKLEIGKPGCVALFNSSVVIADESEDLTKADLGVLKNICDATFDTKRSLYSNEETAEIRSLLIVMTNTLRIPLNRSYIRKFAYLGAGESKGGHNAEFNPDDEARFKRLSLSPRVHEYWYNHLTALNVDIYKATTKYGTEHLQEDNMDDLLDELRLIESGKSDFFCVGNDGNKYRVDTGSTFRQIELKNYLLSRSDKTLLNGKKDIVKVLRGYIERGQLNWSINERVSNLKNGMVKKQTTSITVRSCSAIEQNQSLLYSQPDVLLPNTQKKATIKRYVPNKTFAGYPTR